MTIGVLVEISCLSRNLRPSSVKRNRRIKKISVLLNRHRTVTLSLRASPSLQRNCSNSVVKRKLRLTSYLHSIIFSSRPHFHFNRTTCSNCLLRILLYSVNSTLNSELNASTNTTLAEKPADRFSCNFSR